DRLLQPDRVVGRLDDAGQGVQAVGETRRRPLDRPGGGEAVGDAVEVVVVPHAVGVERGDEGAAVGLEPHPALALQGDERLPQRDAADAQLGGDGVLRHPVAGAEAALEDHAPHVERRHLGTGGRARRSGRSRPHRGRRAPRRRHESHIICDHPLGARPSGVTMLVSAPTEPIDDLVARIPPIVDCDAHVVEPPDVWTSRLPARYRDVGPHVEMLPAGTVKLVDAGYVEEPGTDGPLVAWWCYEDKRISVKRTIAAAGVPADEVELRSITYDDMR